MSTLKIVQNKPFNKNMKGTIKMESKNFIQNYEELQETILDILKLQGEIAESSDADTYQKEDDMPIVIDTPKYQIFANFDNSKTLITIKGKIKDKTLMISEKITNPNYVKLFKLFRLFEDLIDEGLDYESSK